MVGGQHRYTGSDERSSTYTLADADEGKAITVQVSFTDDGGNDETLTSAATDAVSAAPASNTPATGAPTVSVARPRWGRR